MSNKLFKLAFQLAIIWLPWSVRRWLLVVVLGFKIHPTAYVGKSLLIPRRLVMAPHSRIGHFNLAHGVEEIQLERHASIGKWNWLCGSPLDDGRYFKAFPNRRPRLHLHEHSAIVSRNFIDCTDEIEIGAFALLAGIRHQLFTHGIDLRTANQSCAPISIGRYCLIGTGCIFLKGSSLPDYSALGAGSVVHKQHETTHTLYSGVPAAPVKQLNKNWAFFVRRIGTSDSDTAPVFDRHDEP